MTHLPRSDIQAASFSVDHDMAGYDSSHDQHGHKNMGTAPIAAAPALTSAPAPASFIGTSAAMQILYGQIERAARSLAPVFIMGETGTGKDVCAQAIHRHSPRAAHPFIAINCAAIPRDLLESELFGHVKGAFTGAINDREGAATLAHKGTLFLDEVAEMAPDMQTKLLRFLQDFTFRRVGGNAPERTDVRIICATNRDPLREIAAGHLREDLYFRLHVIPLQIPRLHERDDDVLDIAYALMRRYSAEEHKNFSALSPAVQDFFRHYEWPGNVRQLQNLLRYICVMFDGDTITADMLPASLLPETDVHGSADGRGMPARPGAANPLAGPVPDVHPSPSTTSLPPEGLPEWLSGMSLADIERHVIESTVARMHGNVPQAAAHLGVAPSTLYRKRLSWLPELQKEGETLPPSLTPERTQP